MKIVFKAVLWFFCGLGMMLAAGLIYVALTLFPPPNRF
jgi:hypothetical protein